ncbi:alpha/beta fold hydrolase [Pseudomonas sp. dw_358]|uniref:alpha/beta hydrolase n=1 Tax=Pseudomonas sp. dw_358 TaxID=2720083 RepID=UPI001BD56D79|nr:alpha/beta fold hydrolase [Pseudomonas sp. dw_358]
MEKTSLAQRLLLAALLLTGIAQAQADDTLHTDLPVPYLEQAVSRSDQPLVIFLHGYGSNEADLFSLREELPDGYTYLSLRAPGTVEQDAYKWFTSKREGADYDGVTAELASSQKLLGDFIVKAVAKYHTRADKVVLVGFSQGAIMSYEVALRRPASVRGIAVLSGSLLPVLHAELKPSPALKNLAVFIGHGTDDPQLPVKDATDADQILQGLGLTPQLHIYPGQPHSVSAMEVADLKAWLQQTLGTP